MIVVEFTNPSGDTDVMTAENYKHFVERFDLKYPGKSLPESSDLYTSDCPSLDRVRKSMTGLVGFDSPDGRDVLEPLYKFADEVILNERKEQREEATSNLAKAMSFDAQDHRPSRAQRQQLKEKEASHKADLYKNDGPPDGMDPGTLGG